MFKDEAEMKAAFSVMGEVMAEKLQESRSDCGFCGSEDRRKQHLKEHIFLGWMLAILDKIIPWVIIGLLGWYALNTYNAAVHVDTEPRTSQVEQGNQ